MIPKVHEFSLPIKDTVWFPARCGRVEAPLRWCTHRWRSVFSLCCTSVDRG